MEKSQKIKSFFPRLVSIDGFRKYKGFLKNNYKVCRLKINYNDDKTRFIRDHHELDQMIIKFLSKARPFHVLDLHQSFQAIQDIPQEKIMQMAKRHSRAQSLLLPFFKQRFLVSSEIVQQCTLWLKYTPNLKEFSLISLLNQTSDPEGNFTQETDSLFKTLKSCRNLESLTIHANNSAKSNIQAWLNFQKYPLGLKKLSLNFQTNASVIIIQEDDRFGSLTYENLSLNKFKKLTHLDLALPAHTQLWTQIISSISKENSLIHLKLNYHMYGGPQNTTLQISSPENWIHFLPQLKSLQLKFHQYPEGLDDFLPQLLRCNLLNFQFIIKTKSNLNFNIAILSEFLEKQNNLKKLVLKFYNDWSSKEAQSFLNRLYLQISNLKTLEKLKLYFYNTVKYQLQSVPSVQQLFQNSRSIKTFEFVQDVSPPVLMLELLKLCQKVAPTLQKLMIWTRQIHLTDNLIKELFELLENLKNIQNINISTLVFQQPHQFFKTSLCFESFRHLRCAEFPRFHGEIDRQHYLMTLKNIMSLKSMRKVVLPFVDFEKAKHKKELNLVLQSIQQKNCEAEIWEIYYNCTELYDDRFQRNWKLDLNC